MTVGAISPETERRAPRGFFAGDSRARTLLLGLLLVLATVAIYYPVVHNPFFNPDDYIYVTNNPHIQTPLNWETIHWALTTQRSYWHPVTWLTLAVDFQFFGLNPAGYHGVNLGFHILNVLVLFWVLRRATGYTGRSFAVAALFAVHPINVEAVNWVAERKTLLCTLFCLLTLAAYRWYALKPQETRRWALVVVLFVLALMGKPLAVALPVLLLLWDYWPLRRLFPNEAGAAEGLASSVVYPAATLGALVKEKIPLLALCVLDMLTTVSNQGVLRPPQIWLHPFSNRLANAIVAYVRYIGKALWPSGLAPFYPHPGASLRAWQVAAALVVLLAISALIAAAWRRRYLTVGWLWFLGVLFLNIGIVQLGDQAMADRYAYLSFIGLYLMIGWGVAEWAGQRHSGAGWLPATTAIVLLALCVLTHRQVEFWKDELTLWSHTLDVTSNNWTAEYRVGDELAAQGKTEEAIGHLRRSLALDPTNAYTIIKIGVYERERHNLPAAIDYFQRAVDSPDSDLETKARALGNLGTVYRELGDPVKAEECFKQQAANLRQAEQENRRF